MGTVEAASNAVVPVNHGTRPFEYLMVFPTWQNDIYQLLVLTKLGLTELPAEILTLTCLTKFNFSDNDLSVLPKMLEKLPSLEEIIGRNNKIKNNKNDGPYSAAVQVGRPVSKQFDIFQL